MYFFFLFPLETSVQESEEEVTDTEQAENWFSLTSAQRICGEYLEHFKFW